MTDKEADALMAALDDLRGQLDTQSRINEVMGLALTNLTREAQQVINLRDAGADVLQDAITGLEEMIPCDDCLHAPCVCPNE